MSLNAGLLTEESTSRYLDIDGVKLHYSEAGSGPPLVCLNAWGEGVTAWFTYHKNFEALAASHRVLLLDPPHSGRSDPAPANELRPEQRREIVCRYIARFMDALGLDEVSLIGTSTGGTTALYFAQLYPDRVSRLVLSGCGVSNGDNALLFNPVFYDDETSDVVCRQEGIKLGLAAMLDPSRSNIERFAREALVFDEKIIGDEHVEYLVNVAAQPTSARKREELHHFYGNFVTHNNLSDLTKMKIPTLFFHGRYDNVVSPEVAVQTVGLIPNCRTVLLRCGNLLPFEKPRDFNAMTLAFLAS
ncbi:alpha/beta fold hydrolase [Rhodococcus wratislaviensis]|uniref:alpha/beta fold hydrolase n=1 Tax=Rhodococcus wratislaviensis TaxID=44752 RepID=UPI001788B1B7|nr:alpha/beta hydrolase [Rhodococcus wratislaviensis]